MRITLGDKQRSFMGAWILAALVILGVNGLNLTNLLDQPLLGNSQEVKGIRRQWRLLEQLSALAIREAKAVADADLDRVFSRFEPLQVPESWDPDPNAEKAEEAETERKPFGPILPVLTGIITVTDLEGNARSTAVFNGRRFREKEMVEGFRIERIAEEGVTLSRSGADWFVPAPEGGYTAIRKYLD